MRGRGIFQLCNESRYAQESLVRGISVTAPINVGKTKRNPVSYQSLAPRNAKFLT